MNTKTNYYNEIKDTLVKNEIYKKAKDYSKNRNDLMSYYKVGKLLIEAQGGEDRAKYGDKLIKEYSEKLTEELGKGYSSVNLKRMRQFYLIIKKGSPVANQLTWSHYMELLGLKNIEEIKYYINISITENLSKRELRQRIKENEYERLPHKQELDKPKVNTFVKNPIIIRTNKNIEKVNEYTLHNLILEDLDYFLKQLGQGFTYVGNEYKIKIGSVNHYIDILLFNYLHNCFVVIELKIRKFNSKDIGQITEYINYVDENIKTEYNNDTFGIIICRKNNEWVAKYVKPNNVDITTYQFFPIG